MRLVSCRLKLSGVGCMLKDVMEDAMMCMYNENPESILVLSEPSFFDIMEENSKLTDARIQVLSDNLGTHSSSDESTKIMSFEKARTDQGVMSNGVLVGDQFVDSEMISECSELHVFVLDIHVEKTWAPVAIRADEFEVVSLSERMWFPSVDGYGYRVVYKRIDPPRSLEHNVDVQYQSLLRRIIDKSRMVPRKNRTDTETVSIFGEQIRVDISETIPALTTKRIPLKGCVEELLWFIRGDTNAYSMKTPIWKENSKRSELDKRGLCHLEEGDCGANYSFQWRFNGQQYISCNEQYEYYTRGDQLYNIINSIKEDPYSRRHFMSAWNPTDLDKTVLPPCHVSAQFYVDNDGGLSCHMYQRSCDAFLGLPWNVLSYSILTHLIAKLTDFVPKELIISIGDAHIYQNHIDQVQELLKREPLAGPQLLISDAVATKPLHMLKTDDFEFVGYFPHPSIRAKMAV